MQPVGKGEKGRMSSVGLELKGSLMRRPGAQEVEKPTSSFWTG